MSAGYYSAVRKFVWILVIVLFILHQDFWWWEDVEPLVFGFLPIGLAYHAGISIASAIVWALAVKYCWPADVEVAAHEFVETADRHREL